MMQLFDLLISLLMTMGYVICLIGLIYICEVVKLDFYEQVHKTVSAIHASIKLLLTACAATILILFLKSGMVISYSFLFGIVLINLLIIRYAHHLHGKKE